MVTGMNDPVSVRLLGPVEVVVDGVATAVVGLRRTAVLAALALNLGHRVAVDQLIDAAWGDAPPPGATATLRSHVSYLRQILGSRDAITVSQHAGYQLDPGTSTDVRLAEQLIAEARNDPDPARREGLLQDAIALWRGATRSPD